MCDENSKCCEQAEGRCSREESGECACNQEQAQAPGAIREPEYLKHIRVNVLDMTQEQFSVLVGVSIATLRNWERGQTPVPPYFEAVLKVIEADPQMAMSVLGVARCSDTPVETGWDKVQPGSPSEHARKMAAEKLKADPLFSEMMDATERLKDFADAARTLGYDFDRKDVLGLAVLVGLTRIHKFIHY